MNTLIIGMGEIGSSLYKLLSPAYSTWGIDIKQELNTSLPCAVPEKIKVMHVCIRYSDDFNFIVKTYIEKYQPEIIDICSTVPVGTTESIDPSACHSTTRGLHPNLVEGLKTITKHVGGDNCLKLSAYFNAIGISTMSHPKAKTTELLHILNNVHYGVNLMFADEAAKLCRHYGVDYFDWMKYGETNNQGYARLGHLTKVRSILMPPGGKIGGHCVVSSAQLLSKGNMLIDLLANYNEEK